MTSSQDTTISSLKVTGISTLVGMLGLTAGISGALLFGDQSPEISGIGADGSTQIIYGQYNRTDLTATGGLVGYNVFTYANPLTSTGSIEQFCIEVVTPTPHATMTVDCGIVGDDATGSGTDLFNNETLSEGLHCAVPGTTEVVFGPTERIKCASLTGTGGSLDAEGYTQFRETVLD